MNVRLQYTMAFTAGVHYGDRLIMNNYVLKLWMITMTKESENNNIAFERLKFFINHELDSTIFIDQTNIDQIISYLQAGVKVTTLPNQPVDQIVGVMLFHKLNAIMEGRMTVVETELSSQLGDNMVYIHSENETAEDLTIPDWWLTPDIITCDLELLESDKVVKMHGTSRWRELDLAWPADVEMNEQDQNGNIVFADFKKDETK